MIFTTTAINIYDKDEHKAKLKRGRKKKKNNDEEEEEEELPCATIMLRKFKSVSITYFYFIVSY